MYTVKLMSRKRRLDRRRFLERELPKYLAQQKRVNAMTNKERTAWARRGYPALTK